MANLESLHETNVELLGQANNQIARLRVLLRTAVAGRNVALGRPSAVALQPGDVAILDALGEPDAGQALVEAAAYGQQEVSNYMTVLKKRRLMLVAVLKTSCLASKTAGSLRCPALPTLIE